MTTIDILVEANDPRILDETVQGIPGCTAVVLGGPDYVSHEGAWVVRCFEGAEFLKFVIGTQGYGKVVRELSEIL